MGTNVLFDKLSRHRKALAKQLADPAIAGFWKMVVDKYSERAHFLYELIQNADDAKATYVRIVIEKDGLYFIHNGTVPFTVTDPDDEGKGCPIGHLNSLTSVGNSTKLDSEDKIGKFGIGFKSVFQYTKCPHVEDDYISFCLHDYIVPIEDNRIKNMRKDGETLFYLPFANPTVALSDIEKSLSTMDNPLIFMINLHSIEWCGTSESNKGSFTKELCHVDTFKGRCGQPITHELVRLEGSVGATKGQFHYFWNCVKHNEKLLKIAVVYGADSKGNVCSIVGRNNLFCFFPVNDKIENLPFLVHAPFLLTENREQIKKTEQWNVQLTEQLALLASSVLIYHSLFEKCDTDILGLYPLADSADPFLLSPIVKNVIYTLKTETVVKTKSGLVTADEVRYCDNAALVEHINDEQVSLISEQNKKWGYGFLHKLSSSERSSKLTFLNKHSLIGEWIEPESLIGLLTPEFMDNQPTEWVACLYQILGKKKSLLASDAVRKTPFVRCEDGVYRAAYSQRGTEQIFVRPQSDVAETTSNLYYVDKAIADDAFLNQIGIFVPSEETYIEKTILMAYAEGKRDRANVDVLAKDMERLATYFSSVLYKAEEKARFVDLIRNIPFIATIKGDTCVFSKASSSYFHSEDLLTYFSGSDKVEVVDARLILAIEPSQRDKTYFFLQTLGVSFYPRLVDVNRNPNDSIVNTLHLAPKSLRVMDNGDQIIVDKEIDGFDSLLNTWNVKSALAFYRMLGKMIGECGAYFFRRQLNGAYSYYEKAKKNRTDEPILYSTAYNQLFKAKWFPSESNTNLELADVCEATQLNDKCYQTDVDKQVLMFFGINFDSNLMNLAPEQRNSVLLVEQLKKNGISEDDLKALIAGEAHIVYK